MSKSPYKYKSIASVYLTLTILTSSYGAYSAIPAIVQDKGEVIENLKDNLDNNVDDETVVSRSSSVSEEVTFEDIMEDQLNKEGGGSLEDTVMVDTSGLYEEKQSAQSATVEDTSKTPSTNQLQSPTANVDGNDLFTLNSDNDPFSMDTDKGQKTNSTKPQQATESQQVKSTQQTAKSQQTAKPQQTVKTQTNTDSWVGTSDPFNMTNGDEKTKQNTVQSTKPSTNQSAKSNNVTSESKGEVVSSKTEHAHEITSDILSQLESSGILDKSKKITNVSNINLSTSFASTCLNLSKESVNTVYTGMASNDICSISYDESKNIIKVQINKDTQKTPVDIYELFPNVGKGMIDIVNITEYAFDIEQDVDLDGSVKTFKVKATGGYNGHIECLIGGAPVVIYNNPSIEPIMTADIKNSIHMLENIEEPTPTENTGDSSDLSSDLFSTIEDYSQGFDYGTTDFFGDIEAPEVGQSVEEIQVMDEKQAELNEAIEEIKRELEAKKKSNLANKSDWGITQRDTSVLKDNITDGSELETYKGIKLDVIDLTGNQVDLEEATRNEKPATILRGQRIDVVTEMPETRIPNSVYVAFILGIFDLAMYYYYLSLYKKEYRRYLETRGLLGVMEEAEVDNTGRAEIEGVSVNTDKEIIDSYIDLTSLIDDEEDKGLNSSLDIENM